MTHDIQVGQVYGPVRSKEETDEGEVVYGEHLRLVYEDDERVILRSDRRFNNQKGHHYLSEDRDTFIKNAGSGFYKLLDDVKNAPPQSSDGIVSALKLARKHQNRYAHQVTCGAGRKHKHKLEALDELVEEMEDLSENVADHEPEELEWTEVSGIGNGTAGNMHDAGYTTVADVLAASDDDLLSLGGMGEGNLGNLREYVESEDL